MLLQMGVWHVVFYDGAMIKLLTLNVHAWLEVAQIPKIYALAREIVQRDVDVVCLQEVNQFIESPIVDDVAGVAGGGLFVGDPQHPVRVDNYARILVGALAHYGGKGFYWTWDSAHLGFDCFDEGIAIVSRAPIAEVRRIDHCPLFVDDYDNVRRRASIAVRLDGGEPVWGVSSHFSWWADPAAHPDEDQGFPIGVLPEGSDGLLFPHEWRQVSAACARLREESGLPVVIAGDFNNAADVAGQGYSLVMADGCWSDSFLAADSVSGEATVHKRIHGWSNNTKALRIDYVFTSAGVSPRSHEVVFADDSPSAISDHSGILVELDTTPI